MVCCFSSTLLVIATLQCGLAGWSVYVMLLASDTGIFLWTKPRPVGHLKGKSTFSTLGLTVGFLFLLGSYFFSLGLMY